MNINQQPDALSLSGNLKELIIEGVTSVSVTLALSVGGEQILEHVYHPDDEGNITIDLRRHVEEQLSFLIASDTTQKWQQTHLARTFSFTVTPSDDGTALSGSFTAVRCGIDRPFETAANWLKANFLTWQPTVKHVTYSTPEFLTYYASAACRLMVKVYYPDGTDDTLDPIQLTAGAWTIPVFYAVIAARLGLSDPEDLSDAEQLPGAYDVWIADNSGNILTYVQRYVAGGLRENEQWVLFENSLGGLDCFRAYGQGSIEATHEHQLAETDDSTEEYRTDTMRIERRSSGWLKMSERRWLLDFFPARRRWICENGSFRPIVLTEDTVSYTIDNMPAEFGFSFRYATNHTYLNIPRLEAPQTVLNIKAPDLQSFSVPPRLVEFPRLDPSEGALIPVQSPYADHWSAISLAAIISQTESVLPTWPGSTNLTTLGTITTGKWHGTPIEDAYIVSASIWNAKYDKPDGGIPKTDLDSSVQTSLGYANLFADLFTKESDGNGGYRIKANYSLYTEGFLSAGGIGSGGGGGGGAVSSIYVNSHLYTPDSDGKITLPDYPTQITWDNIQDKPNWLIALPGLIPSQATSSNQLADKAFVNSSVQTATANFRGNWNDWVSVPSVASGYPEDYSGSKKPTVNDYMVVADATGFGTSYTGTWRFKYSGNWDSLGKSGWLPEYRVNESPMTAAQLAAINSGITATKVSQYDEYADSKVNKTTTVNGHALSSDVTVTKSDVGLGNVDNTSDANKEVLSAKKLKTKRTIWGQNFDGTGNVSGALTGVTSITASGSITTAGTLYANGNILIPNSGVLAFKDTDGNTRNTVTLNSSNQMAFGYGAMMAGYSTLLQGENVYVTTGSASPANRFIFTSAGRLGVGNLSPAYMLDVAGDIHTRQSLRIGGIELKEENGLLHIVGGMYADGQVSAGGLGSGGGVGTVTSVSVKINGTVKGTVTTSGTIDLGGTYMTLGSLPQIPTGSTAGVVGALYIVNTDSQNLYLCVNYVQGHFYWAKIPISGIIS